MKSMIAPCFVDADVLVYAIDPAEPLKQEVAVALVGRLWREQRACTSVQAINEFHAVVTRKLRRVVAPDVAQAYVEELLEWNPLPVDVRLIRQARALEALFRLNWWDCLIVAAARAQHCDILYSEDLHHGAVYESVKVVNPFVSQVQEEPAPYRMPVASPHRPRGRPRKQAAPS
jgi:predicted nucleic acid-binding protein